MIIYHKRLFYIYLSFLTNSQNGLLSKRKLRDGDSARVTNPVLHLRWSTNDLDDRLNVENLHKRRSTWMGLPHPNLQFHRFSQSYRQTLVVVTSNDDSSCKLFHYDFHVS